MNVQVFVFDIKHKTGLPLKKKANMFYIVLSFVLRIHW